jgi:hypothetical protein
VSGQTEKSGHQKAAGAFTHSTLYSFQAFYQQNRRKVLSRHDKEAQYVALFSWFSV